ncbi:MAG TPA: aminoglycoside adenylyltransferase domain-containing protein [Microlunatus sp.]|nr:aminoglycoside adenylyltransferase domain-containing protein [Microlunatus sp.]
MLPAIDQQLIRQVVLQHVRARPEWVEEMQHAGGQAYAVLTLCRATEALATGQQVSKLAAAAVGRARFPEWSPLIDWAREWWYEGGSDSDGGQFDEVRRFVVEVSTRLLTRYDKLLHPGPDSAQPAR